MSPLEAAFFEADFNWVAPLHGVWRDEPAHVEATDRVADRIMREFAALQAPGARTLIGQVVNGPAGSGKTHLIGALRRRAWEAGASFVLIDLVGVTDFWRTALLGFIRSLRQTTPNGQSQYQTVFLSALRGVPEEKKREVMQSREGSGAVRTINAFVSALQSIYSDEALEHSNVVRALLLQNDPDAAEIAYSWLLGLEVEAEDRRALGLTSAPPPPHQLVRGVSWLMSLAGPTMIAIDQIDSIVTASNILIGRSAELDDETEARARAIVQILGGGLMDLYDQTLRSMTVVTCLTESWTILRERALASATNRFAPPLALDSAPWDEEAAKALIGLRLAPAFARCGVAPPYPTWPFSPGAIAEVKGSWPRRILMYCEDYRRKWQGSDHTPECASFLDGSAPLPAAPDLTEAFEGHRRAASVADLLSEADDGASLGHLIRQALELYVAELTLPEQVDSALAHAPPEKKPSLHARLTFIFHDQNELEKHYCFRVIGHAAAVAFQSRLRAAMTDSGVDRRLSFRHLFIVRNAPLPGGKVTKELARQLSADGGRVIAVGEEDLRTFAALIAMREAGVAGFDAWLRAKKPLLGSAFFAAVGLSPPPLSLAGAVEAAERELEATPPRESNLHHKEKTQETFSDRAVIPLGPRLEGGGLGSSAELQARLLVRHTAIFAGSGSGKTVLLRRIVEEAALIGVPSIVLDANNDLARLGEPWPSRPEAFCDDDAAKAKRYAGTVEVVVWTPGLSGGRALSLAALPDFSQTAEGEERRQAVDMGFATLSPLVGVAGAAKEKKAGVLMDALTAFAARGGRDIEGLIAFLADLPIDACAQTKAADRAADMADHLRARIAVNPLLKGKGQTLDPAALFGAARPGATRISVINLSGLVSDETRQDFVNQLQMTLFTYIRKHPSATPRLYAMDEAQIFAPAQTMTPSKASATALAAQARKFGLGMIFATQAPKGIETRIVSNCVTHFYGRMSSPALIEATQAMMAARGRAAADLGRLSAGEFYFTTEGMPAPVKIKTPLCLSRHPQNPATPEELLELARRD